MLEGRAAREEANQESQRASLTIRPWSQKSPREASPMISLWEKTLSGGSMGSAKALPIPTPGTPDW